MQDPFSSEYASTVITATSVTTALPLGQVHKAKGSSATGPAAGDLDSRAFGFEPERYGLGKPRRIVIRGKIASD